jgi:hypothetical protein
MNKDTDYGAPPEPKGHYRALTDAEILESDKFRVLFGDLAQDALGSIEPMDFAVIAIDLIRGDYARAGDNLCTRLLPVIMRAIDQVRYESEPVEPIDPEAP